MQATFHFYGHCFVQCVICTDGPYICTIGFQLTDSFRGMHDDHQEQDKCTTFGWNAMGENSRSCKFFWKHMSMYFTVQYRIPCISMQRSYVLVGNVLQKQL